MNFLKLFDLLEIPEQKRIHRLSVFLDSSAMAKVIYFDENQFLEEDNFFYRIDFKDVQNLEQ